MTLEECTSVYHDAENVLKQGIKAQIVDFPELAHFNELRKTFVTSVKNGSLHEDWDNGIQFFSIAHAKLARTPCRPSWLIDHLCKNCGGDRILAKLNARAGSVEPMIGETFNALKKSLEIMSRLDKNPLLNGIHGSLRTSDLDGQKNLFVIRDLKLWVELRQCLRNIMGDHFSEIVKPSNIREHQRADRLFIFGPPWYLTYRKEEFLLRSPAAPEIVLIGCRHEFEGQIRLSGLDENLLIPISDYKRDHVQNDPFAFETLVSGAPGKFAFKSTPGSQAWESGTIVEALPFKFGNGQGTYFRTDSKVWAVLVDSPGGSPKCAAVEKVEVEDIEPGHLILMTTHGGGDMIPVVADMILPRSKQLRDLQSLWKKALVRKIEEHGIDAVIACLERYGATKASVINVRNWVNPRSLGMENLDSDLKAILRMTGLEPQHKDIKKGIQKLRQAHQSAGAKLQRKLRESLQGKDLRQVFSDGVMEIKHGDGPAKTIYLIEERGVSEDIPEEWEGEIKQIDD